MQFFRSFVERKTMPRQKSLVETTRKAFVKFSADKSMVSIAEATGIPRSWLIAFRDNKIKEPGADRIDNLNRHLQTIQR